MTTTTLTASPTSQAEIRGRATGVTILAFFALAWTGWGTSGVIGGTAQTALVVLAAIASVVCTLLAWRGYRRVSPVADGVGGSGGVAGLAGDDRDGGGGPDVGRRFGLVVAIEWIGLGVAAGVLGAAGHAVAIPAVICLGVGLHFLPLARLFHVRVYVLTGILLCLIAVATLIVGALTGAGALWTALPGFGAAIVLYATIVELLRESARRF